MSDSPSVSSRPTESELDLELVELVNWQRFATHLPDFTRGDIEQIGQDNRDVPRQKLELYGTWLRRCPNASWNYIVLALEKSRENTLADIIKMKFNVVISSDSRVTETHSQTQPSSNSLIQNVTEAQLRSFSQEVYLTSEDIVVQELKQLHRSFTTLARDIRCNLDELVKSGKCSLLHIAAFIQEARVCEIKGLTGVNTIHELFDAILPHNDYLDCELLEMIVEEYLDDEDITKIKAHIDKVKLFKHTTPIKTLKDKLHQYTSIPNISEMHLIVTIKLQADWGRVTLDSIEKLVRNLLQYQHKVRILKVGSGSISVMLLLPKEKLQHFIVSSSQKLQFMRLTGIFRLQIGAITVFEERENKNFTFESAFLESSQCGDDEAVQFLLGLGVNINYSNSEGQTALILASESGQEEVVEMLLSAGANINHQDKYRHTALMVSKENKIFLLLLRPNTNINITKYMGLTPLMIACDLGCLTVVETLLRLKNDPNVYSKSGWNATMFASRNGHLQVVELLLKENADPNVCTNTGCTALMFTSHNGYHQVTELLLNKGANPNIQANNGWTALIFASENGHHQVVEVLLAKGADLNILSNKGWTALMVASQKSYLQVVDLLLKENADPNIQNLKGWTALIFASRNGDHQVVEILLQKGADPNIHANDGLTALIIASVNGHFQVVALLLKACADSNLRYEDGWTALMLASFKGDLQVAELLLKEKSDPNVHNNKGRTPLMFASHNGHLQLAKLLLKEKVDPNTHDNQGWTALMFASQSGHLQLAELLLKENADPNARNNEGSTALIYAIQKGHLQIVELLLKENVNPNVCSNTGCTPLLLASINGHSNVVKMLLQYKANPQVEIRKDLDTFIIAIAEGNTDVVNTFLNHTEIRFDSLSMGWYYACQLGHVPIITLLSNRVDIVSDQTDLIISCAEGDLGTVIDQLMSGKMTPDVQFIHGVTPLMISSSCGHTDIVEALIQSGGNINKTDEFGETALDYAELAKQDTTRVLLLQHGGLHDIDVDSRVRTPEESLLKTVDNISTEKDFSNLQSPHSSRRQRISIKKYLEESIDTYFNKHQSADFTNDPLTIDLNELNSD